MKEQTVVLRRRANSAGAIQIADRKFTLYGLLPGHGVELRVTLVMPSNVLRVPRKQFRKIVGAAARVGRPWGGKCELGGRFGYL